MDEQPSYYTVIPAPVRYDEELVKYPKAILLYGEIVALASMKGYCWASNKYFETRLHVKTRSIQDYMTLLIERGYIWRKLIYEENSKKVSERRLYIRQPHATDFTTPPAADCTDSTTRFEDTTEESKKLSTHPIAYYQTAFGRSPSAILTNELQQWSERLGNVVTNYAIKLAASNGFSFGYVRTTLEDWQEKGIKTLAEAKTAHENHKKQSKQRNSNGNSPEPQAFDTEDKDRNREQVVKELFAKLHDVNRVIIEIATAYDVRISKEEVKRIVGN